MSILSIKPYTDTFVDTNFATPLLLGMEFSTKIIALENELEQLENIHVQNDWSFDLGLVKSYLVGRKKAIVLTDTNQHITWTSRGFVRMTGYSYCEAFNKRPTFLQGPKTLDSTRVKIRESLSKQQPFEGSIVNYRKSGSVYACNVTIIPILNTSKKLVNYIALEEEN
jgi:PAS domain S-box-containing protein